ncbi:MAG: methyltransferase domain-containing protein [Candidatus Edwardsbacteria bacterium]
MRILKSSFALLIWIILSILANLFILSVFLKNLIKVQNRKVLEVADNPNEQLVRFIERSLSQVPLDLDEGLGTVYERRVMQNFLSRLQEEYGIRIVLESPADGISGMPGLNSLEFGKRKGEVILSSPSLKLLTKVRVIWEKEETMDKVQLIQSEVNLFPFSSNSFDLVWNFCILERFFRPEVFVSEMKRVSRQYILLVIQNRYNVGTILHRVYHRFMGQVWDHGYSQQMRLKTLRQIAQNCNLKILEIGAIDTPPSMDTWDMPLRGELKRVMSLLGKEWKWKATSKKEKSRFLGFLMRLERDLPHWFNLFQTHHLYLLAQKG